MTPWTNDEDNEPLKMLARRGQPRPAFGNRRMIEGNKGCKMETDRHSNQKKTPSKEKKPAAVTASSAVADRVGGRTGQHGKNTIGQRQTLVGAKLLRKSHSA